MDNILLGMEAHSMSELPKEITDKDGDLLGRSDDVLIDIDGKREHFIIGFCSYDDETHEFDGWVYYNNDFKVTKNAKWLRLPLAKYDPK
jgi:hypothetical protein